MAEFYKAIPLKENVYRFTSVENVFFELLEGEERALLIDTGYGFGDVKSAVREITDKPLTIVNTHGHVDHTCGNFQFPDEEIYISPEDLDLLHLHNSRSFREESVRLAEHVPDYATGQEVYGLPQDFNPFWYLAGDCGRHILPLTDGMVFDLGGVTVRTVATPGHTRGGMSFYYEEEGWFYAGDAANPFLWLFDSYATDRRTHIATLDRIAQIKPERIYGAHAPAPFTMEDLAMFKRAAIEADYETGVPFATPIMPQCKDIRVCIMNGKTMADIGTPGFYAILLDESRKEL